MKNRTTSTFVFLILVIKCFTPDLGYAQDKIRIGVPLFPTVSFPVFIAHEKGFFEKNGLKAEIIRINSEPTTYQALISGDIDATSGAPTGLVQSNLQGVPVVSLGSWDNLVSYTVATREKIDDLSQLKGKKSASIDSAANRRWFSESCWRTPASTPQRTLPCCSSAARRSGWPH